MAGLFSFLGGFHPLISVHSTAPVWALHLSNDLLIREIKEIPSSAPHIPTSILHGHSCVASFMGGFQWNYKPLALAIASCC